MSLAESAMPDRQPSPRLSVNLASNNPFRNRANSPLLASPTSASSERPTSRNPFLATFEEDGQTERPVAASGTMISPRSPEGRVSPLRRAATDRVGEDLFSGLSLLDKPTSRGSAKPHTPPQSPQRGQPMPERSHRPTRSQGEDSSKPPEGASRRAMRPPGRPNDPNAVNSPERVQRRPRRNSESSVLDKGGLGEEEKRRRDRRRRERDAKDGKTRPGKARGPRGYDVIDKLDVTGIYGFGQFHHDGPFDACNPHRNRKKDRRAPMQAFPVGSANNALGGSGPVNKHIDLDQLHGRGTEGYTDYATTGASSAALPQMVASTASTGQQTRILAEGVYNPKGAIAQVHGEESVGLGTSTFLEGAPASRIDMERRTSEAEVVPFSQQSNLQRKKSLAQRFRGISQPRRGFNDGPMTTGSRLITSNQRVAGQEPERSGSLSAGGVTKLTEQNPFFEDYDAAYDRKGAAINKTSVTFDESDRPQTSGGRVRTPTSPRRPSALERKGSTDVGTGDEGKGGGLLNRMKSLKAGGKRNRPTPPPPPPRETA